MNQVSDFTMKTIGYDVNTLILVMATAIGAYGGFPSPPPILQSIMNFPLIQWGLVFVLCYQGGSGQDPKLALLATITLLSLHLTLSLI